MDFAIAYVVVMLILAVYIGILQDKIKKLKDEVHCYKYSYYSEQQQSETYRACLFVAIRDMIDNGWYKKEGEAFYMLFTRIKPYRFSKVLDIKTLTARMLYHQNSMKFSHDYEQELIEKGN